MIFHTVPLVYVGLAIRSGCLGYDPWNNQGSENSHSFPFPLFSLPMQPTHWSATAAKKIAYQGSFHSFKMLTSVPMTSLVWTKLNVTKASRRMEVRIKSLYGVSVTN